LREIYFSQRRKGIRD